MMFGKWKDDLYLLISRCVKRDPKAAITWISQVEHAQSVDELVGDASPFTSVDVLLQGHLHKKLHGLQLVQFKQLQNRYLAQSEILNGRQMLWILF